MDPDRQAALARGDSRRASGDTTAALAAYAEAGLDRADSGPLEAELAWRAGLAYQQLGEARLALDVYGRASTAHAAPVDQAWLSAGAATAHWLLGETDDALERAHVAVEQAQATADDQVLAAAYVALALSVSLGGDPATVEEAYARAAGHAAAAGDLVQLARIDINRSHHLLADARFAEAVETAARGGAAAAQLGSAPLLAVALTNEADGLLRLARYDDAVDRCERGLALAGEIGTRRTAGALVSLAQVHLRRGSSAQARAALEQALRLTADVPDRQVRAPALACLALVLLADDDVPLAVASAAEALESARGSARLPALLAAGRTARANGDLEGARVRAGQAVEHARQRRERAWLAEALELRATTVEPPRARAALREAHQIWQDAAAGNDADRVQILLAQLPSPSRTDRLAGRIALARLTASGLPAPGVVLQPDHPVVQIRTFGRFEVLVDDAAVPAEAWQSRRARELLRLLVCRRGRAVPRMEICETLWPDDDPDRTTHRLSVLLSIVRGVVGPDSIVTDQACVALDASKVQVDVEQFLADVSDAVVLRERGSTTDAQTLLADAVRSYTDDPFADAPYDDETGGLRDEARAAYLQALGMLAECCRRAGAYDQAAAHLRRLLGQDRFDEDAHRRLIAVLRQAGRHGQARLAAARYRAAMADLGLPAAV